MQCGSTLVELLMSTLFVSLLMAMSYSFARAAVMSARVLEIKSESQEVAVMALDVMVRELRMAGFSAAAQPLAAMRAADREYVEVAADLNGDGDTDDPNELIAYSYDAQQHELMRATGGGSPQPLARHVPLNGLRFAFFDAAGSEMPVTSGGMTAEERLRIHRIDARLRVELSNPDPRATQPLTTTVSISACLRNQ
jgi:type IV pilus assembly protein PilW